MNQISTQLDGAEVSFYKESIANTKEGTYKRLEVIINEPKLDNSDLEASALFLRSVPALMVVDAKIPNLSEYKYVDVTINSKRLGKVSTRYSISQLLQVSACFPAIDGFVYGMEHKDKDSLQYYAGPKNFAHVPIDSFVSMLYKADSLYGKMGSKKFQGFQIDTAKNDPFINYTVIFRRGKNKQFIDIVIDPNIKKVIKGSF